MEEFEPLPSVAPQVRRLGAVLSLFDGMDVGAPVIDGDLAQVEASWRELRRSPAGRPRIVHFAGHGVTRGRVLYLPVHDSRPDDLPDSAISVDRWLNEVEHGSDSSPVLFLLDVCGAGAATDFQLFQDVPEADRRSWVIAACSGNESAFGARFTQAAARALERLRLGHWDISPALSHVPVETVADEIARELVLIDEGYPQTVVHSPRRAASVPVPEFFPNPAFSTDGWQRLRTRLRSALRELASEFDPGLDPVHFLTRASGRPQEGAAMTGCLFTGRTRELTLIRDWLAGDDPLLLVTGSPGSGKSALLGATVFLAHPQLTELSTLLTSRILARHRPQRRFPTLVAVHARHRGVDEVIASILAQLQPEGTAPVMTDNRDQAVAELLRTAGELPEPVVLVLDAVDESPESTGIVHELLGEILHRIRPDGRPLFRALVGMRPLRTDGHLLHEELLSARALPPDSELLVHEAALTPEVGPLVLVDEVHRSRAGLLFHHSAFLHRSVPAPGALLDLDASTGNAELADDLAVYLSDVLSGAAQYGDEADRESVTRAVASAIAHGPERGAFLFAALYADFLRTGPVLSPEEAVGLLPRNLPDLLELHLASALSEDPWMRHLLTGLAQARGVGMPVELVTAAAIAAATAAHRVPGPLSPERSRELLATARFYLRTTIDTDGHQLYRFFHESLVEHFRVLPAETEDFASLLFDTLLETVPGQRSGRAPRWDLAAPYLLRHLTEHAVAVPGGAAIDQLLLDPEYLLRADRTTVWNAVHRAEAPTARRVGAAYRAAISRFDDHTPVDVHRARMQHQLVTHGATGLARRLHDDRDSLRTRWSTGPAARSLLHVVDEDSLGTAVSAAALAAAGGRILAVVGGADGSLQGWDVTSSPEPAFRRFLVSPTDGSIVTQLVSAEFDGRAVMVSVTDRNAVQLHDLDTGSVLASTRVDGDRISAATVIGAGDTTALAVGSVTGGISLIGLLEGEFGSLLHTEDSGSGAIVSLLGVEDEDGGLSFHCLHADPDVPGTEVLRELDGRPVVLATYGPRQEVCIRPVGEPVPLLSLIAYDRATSVVPVNGDTVHSITLPKDRRLAFADLGRFRRHLLALSAHHDGDLRVWDLDVCPRSGHSVDRWYHHRSLDVVRLDGSELAVSTDLTFGEVKVWDIGSGTERPGFDGLGKLTHAVTVAAKGAARIITVSAANELDTFDLVDGDVESTVLLPGPVTALTAVPHGASVRAVTGCADGRIRVWDSSSEVPSLVLSGPTEPVTALAVSEPAGEPLLVSVHGERHVCVWSLADGTRRRSLTLDRVGALGTAEGRPCAVEWSSEGSQVRVTDLLSGDFLGTVIAPGLQMATICQAESGPVLVASTGKRVLQAWDVRSGEPIGSPAAVPGTIRTIVPRPGGVLVGSEDGQVAALDWPSTAPTASPRPDGATVLATHVLAWLPGELLCGTALADGWELYTLDEWQEGRPPSFGTVCVAPVTASAVLLRDTAIAVLEPDGFEVVRMYACPYEISGVDGAPGGPWAFPSYTVYSHPTEGAEQ
ncbi:NACHT and WD repeat domain-containing protein [Kitasatospora sp. YST-16]|uniref:NACHT and WD repeat domain-containing protein n=1 Tax=Kitasatospora sp. YST-16 TaxID=2998080 RepID=UPI002283BEBB|nr:NACHT and WD repeat domain-containing protein [Kitasatospora sp. YST-16]WAL75789.1 NACHT and WD repeat domain-containing protein [Kitasatospora sp. YST-16]WNW41857.1 NACHT and WD repeat domain-containing protein [Streptomyces sp. Li-HN-5-13]